MFDSATLTISGNVVANPVVTGTAENPERVSLRVISNRRRRNTETGEWEQIDEYAVNVVCWRKLARGVANSIRRGDPVLVIGRISEREYENKAGERRWHTEVVADFVGRDLSYGVAGPFSRFTRLDRLQLERDGGADIGGELAALAGTDAGPADGIPAQSGGVPAPSEGDSEAAFEPAGVAF